MGWACVSDRRGLSVGGRAALRVRSSPAGWTGLRSSAEASRPVRFRLPAIRPDRPGLAWRSRRGFLCLEAAERVANAFEGSSAQIDSFVESHPGALMARRRHVPIQSVAAVRLGDTRH